MCVCAQECVYVYVMYVWVLTEGKKNVICPTDEMTGNCNPILML